MYGAENVYKSMYQVFSVSFCLSVLVYLCKVSLSVLKDGFFLFFFQNKTGILQSVLLLTIKIALCLVAYALNYEFNALLDALLDMS